MTKGKLSPARTAAEWSRMTGVDRPNVATIRRWIREGVRGIRLRAALCGGRWYVRPDDLHDFHIAINEAATRKGVAR